MKLNYIKPQIELHIVKIQSLLETVSLQAGDDYTEGTKTGRAKRRNNLNDWEQDDEWEDDNQGVAF